MGSASLCSLVFLPFDVSTGTGQVYKIRFGFVSVALSPTKAPLLILLYAKITRLL